METKFNFKSAICTSIEQSERLLALGLKKETADCYLFEYDKEKYKVIADSWLNLIADEQYYSKYKDACFPAWSLNRLIELKQPNTIDNEVVVLSREQTYDKLIGIIEKSIEGGKFPKEYLERKE